jgi:hypothetical protein
MDCEWLWLEDEAETVADLMEGLRDKARVRAFHHIPELTRHLRKIRRDVEAGQIRIGLILDVMITGAPRILRPAGWVESMKEEDVLATNDGYEAGLVFYEKMVLGEDGARAVIHPPPPVLFLTVMHKDSSDIQGILTRIMQKWAKCAGTETRNAKVSFLTKWEVDPSSLLNELHRLEG